MNKLSDIEKIQLIHDIFERARVAIARSIDEGMDKYEAEMLKEVIVDKDPDEA